MVSENGLFYGAAVGVDVDDNDKLAATRLKKSVNNLRLFFVISSLHAGRFA